MVGVPVSGDVRIDFDAARQSRAGWNRRDDRGAEAGNEIQADERAERDVVMRINRFLDCSQVLDGGTTFWRVRLADGSEVELGIEGAIEVPPAKRRIILGGRRLPVGSAEEKKVIDAVRLYLKGADAEANEMVRSKEGIAGAEGFLEGITVRSEPDEHLATVHLRKMELMDLWERHGSKAPSSDEGQRRKWCACCDFFTLVEGGPEICPVCYWDDSSEYWGNGLTLQEARTNYKRIGACEPNCVPYVRRPGPEELKD